MSAPVDVLVVPALYPHRTLHHEAAKDPESVLRWARTWLSGEAAHHGELLRAAADTVATREAAVAELIEVGKALLAGSVAQATAADHADMPAEDKADAEFRASVARDAMRAALARVGGAS